MATAKKSIESKAFQSFLAKEKKYNIQARLEWEMACNTSKDRGHVWNQSEINALYSRDDWHQGQGATKTCHLECHNGEDFQFIVVKRHQTYGYIDEHQYNPDYYHTGNQLVDEIRCWEKFSNTDDADFLCPIMKYFTSKSDKVVATSEKMQENVVIIAQKAVEVDDCYSCCQIAANMNGFDDASERYEAMKSFSKKQGWRDAIHNPGNCGVIYDYDKHEYKAVFIDYAL